MSDNDTRSAVGAGAADAAERPASDAAGLIAARVELLRWSDEVLEQTGRAGVSAADAREIVLAELMTRRHAAIPAAMVQPLADALNAIPVPTSGPAEFILRLGRDRVRIARLDEERPPAGRAALHALTSAAADAALLAAGEPPLDPNRVVAAVAARTGQRAQITALVRRGCVLARRGPELGALRRRLPVQEPWMTDAHLLRRWRESGEEACAAAEKVLAERDRRLRAALTDAQSVVAKAGRWFEGYDVELPSARKAADALRHWGDAPLGTDALEDLTAAVVDELQAATSGHSDPRHARADWSSPCADARPFYLAAPRAVAKRLRANIGRIVWGPRSDPPVAYGQFPLTRREPNSFSPFWDIDEFRLFEVEPTHGFVEHDRELQPRGGWDVPSRRHASAVRVIGELDRWRVVGPNHRGVCGIVERVRTLSRAEVTALNRAHSRAVAGNDQPWRVALAAAQRQAEQEDLSAPFDWVYSITRKLVLRKHGDVARRAAAAAAAAAQAAVVGLAPGSGRDFLPGYEPLVGPWLEVTGW